MRKLSRIIALVGAFALSTTAVAEETIDVQEAQKLYEALLKGGKRLEDLTPQELQAVRELNRLLQEGKIKKRTPREKCFDEEIDRLGKEPSELDLRVIDLKCSQL